LEYNWNFKISKKPGLILTMGNIYKLSLKDGAGERAREGGREQERKREIK